MKNLNKRIAYMTGASIGAIGLSIMAATPAEAACTITGNLKDCAVNTTTNNTSGLLGDDRHIDFFGGGGQLVVAPTILVDGFGLAAIDVNGSNSLSVTNDGVVQINALLSASTGGSNAALFIGSNSLTATSVSYAGTGDVSNLGNGGSGLEIKSGTATITADIGGSIATLNGSAVATTSNGAGNTTITTAAGEFIKATNGFGIAALANGAGSITVTNAATIDSSSAGLNTLGGGIAVSSGLAGTGNLTVVNNGTIGLLNDRPFNFGISAGIQNAPSAGTIDVSGSGAIFSVGAGISVGAAGTGAVTVDYTGDIDSSASSGIFVDSTNVAGGAISVTTGTQSIHGLQGIAVSAAGSGNASITNGASILSSGTANTLNFGIIAVSIGTGNVAITNNGAIGVAGDRAQTNAIVAGVNNAASAGTLTVTGSGALSSVGDAIFVSTAGTGSATVNYTGAIDASNGDGIHASTISGAQTLTVGGNVTVAGAGMAGVRGLSGSGAVTVNVTGGNVTSAAGPAIAVSSSSAKIVNIGANRTVTQGAGEAAVLSGGTGALTVNNSGILGVAGGLAVDPSLLGTGATVNNLAGGELDGRVDLTDAADTVNNTGVWNATGVNAFGLGNDAVNNLSGGGDIRTAIGTTFDGLETFTNAGIVTTFGALGFTGVATTLTNSGTWNIAGGSAVTGLGAITNSGSINVAGAGASITNTGNVTSSGTFRTIGAFTLNTTGAFANSGTMILAPALFTLAGATGFTNSGTIRAEGGATGITTNVPLANSGTIDLADGLPNDVLTVTGNYVGSGSASLLIDATLTAADKLVITGAASGTTTVGISGTINSFIATPILVVDTGTSTADAFVLGSVTGGSPLFNVGLQQVGDDYYLTSTFNEGAFEPLAVNTLALGLWYQSADEVIAHNRLTSAKAGVGFWGHVYGSTDKSGQKDEQLIGSETLSANNKLKTDRYGLEGGVEYGFGIGRLGVAGGYGHADASRHSGGQLKAKGWNLGVYGEVGGDKGLHAEVLAKTDRYDANFKGGLFDDASTDIRSNGVDGALGYRAGIIGGTGTLDINLGLSHVWTKIDDIDALGFGYDYGKLTSTRVRGGLRATFAGPWLPYLDGTVIHEFDGEGEVALSAGTTSFDLESRGKGTWARIEGGLGGAPKRGPMIVLWGELGDRQGLGLRGGFRF